MLGHAETFPPPSYNSAMQPSVALVPAFLWHTSPTGQHEVEEAVRQLDEAAEKLGRSSGYRDKLLALPLYAGEPARHTADRSSVRGPFGGGGL
jgi:hypothetical protein